MLGTIVAPGFLGTVLRTTEPAAIVSKACAITALKNQQVALLNFLVHNFLHNQGAM